MLCSIFYAQLFNFTSTLDVKLRYDTRSVFFNLLIFFAYLKQKRVYIEDFKQRKTKKSTIKKSKSIIFALSDLPSTCECKIYREHLSVYDLRYIINVIGQ